MLSQRVRKYQITTLTFVFITVYRLGLFSTLYLIDPETFVQVFRFDIWVFLVALPLVYFLGWLLVTWVASKHSVFSLKEKFYRHPIATIILSALYLWDLSFRISEYSLGPGFFNYMINTFELVVFYAFLSFLWWLAVCWFSEKLWRKQRFSFNWYQKTVDILFAVTPPLYKFVLGLIISLVVLVTLFVSLSSVLNYSGEDLLKLGR